MWSLVPEQSEGNNHTSKINVFPVLHTIFFLLAGQKVDLFAPQGAIKSTLWPASRKKHLFSLIVHFTLECFKNTILFTYMKLGISIKISSSLNLIF